MSDRRNQAGRRSEDKVVQLITNPFPAEVIAATQQAHLHALHSLPVGFGYFFIHAGLHSRWELHGLARVYPELSIGILGKINIVLATQERDKT